MTRPGLLDRGKSALWALGFAVGMWYLIDYNTRTDRTDIEVALRIDPPTGLTVEYLGDIERGPDNYPRGRIAVKGPRRVLESWVPKEGVYTVKQRPTDEDFRKERRVAVRDFDFFLPEEVQLDEDTVRPTEIVYRLAEIEKGLVRVRVDWVPDRRDPPGYAVATVDATPPLIEARWPKGAVPPSERRLLALLTSKVDVLSELEARGWKPDSPEPPPTLSLRLLVTGASQSGVEPLEKYVNVTIRFKASASVAEIKVRKVPHVAVPLQTKVPRIRHGPDVADEVELILRGPPTEVNEAAKERLASLVEVYLVPKEGRWPESRLKPPQAGGVDYWELLPQELPETLEVRIGRERLPPTIEVVVPQREFTVDLDPWEAPR